MFASAFPRPRHLAAFVSVALVSGFAAVAIAGAVAGHQGSTPTQHAAAVVSPTAADFGAQLVGVSNQAAKEHGDRGRLSHPKCVQASRTQYMCAYVVTQPHAAAECHLMQGRWTPHLASTITVTLSGRSGRCDSVREAIRTLR